MSTLFRRKSADSLTGSGEESVTSVTAEETPEETAERLSKGFTPGKGKATPKRTDGRRKPEPPPANKREAYKRMRSKQRSERAEAMAGMKAGEERYLMPRDKGPEKQLVRDIVDSRRTIGTWFFGSAFVVLLGTGTGNPTFVMYAQLIWFAIAFATLVDTVLICRKVSRLVRERIAKPAVSMRSLYFYAFMRAITFRRLRMPQARKKFGEAI
ncbi:MAG: DUF3043 domain-containing protein [Hamadaea sp.]|uniref:DUF3043 domain-containing protein n=1 Tax=Hamadaea sp. TaxID=2024425 RepID=UPI0017A97A9C|nr:DUF3043 domain-containing protein [Hamadaea sp.]NUR73200.1 DUF3043 domain-containing protein [Hamadaea sp.]NUT23044.1 DUF3043 domain-containing protein [Hamadaea sp.]